MDLKQIALQSSLNQISQTVFHAGIESGASLGEGVYGRCYHIVLARPPYQAVVKLHKYPGMAGAEALQLIELRKHVPELVPQVYGYLPESELGPAVVMELLAGQTCRRPERLPLPQRRHLQDEAVSLLLKLHQVSHPAGFGSFGGPYYPHWWDYYGRRVLDTYNAIHNSEASRSYLGPEVLALMDRLLERAEQIVSTGTGPAVLLHGDFAVNNLLFDPHTWRITGLIDPMDAEWGVPELDLVNLINGHIKHFELLNSYRRTVELGPYFLLRYWFYHVWKWLFYHVRVGAKSRAWVLRCGQELEKEVARCF